MIQMKRLGGSTSQLIHFPIKSTVATDFSNLSGVTATNLLTPPASAPTLSGSVATTGGQMSGNQTIYVGYTIVIAYGETSLSPLLTVSIPSGTSTNNFTVNVPTLPSGGLGFNFYYGTSNASGSQFFSQYTGSSATAVFFYVNVPTVPSVVPPTSNGAYTSILYGMWQRDVDETATLFTPSVATPGTWTSGGFICPDTVNAPGEYELGIPNGALSASGGAKQVTISLWGALNMAYTEVVIDLVAYNEQDAVHLGLSSLPNASAGTASGLVLNSNSVAVSGTAPSGFLSGIVTPIPANVLQVSGSAVASGVGFPAIDGSNRVSLNLNQVLPPASGVPLGASASVGTALVAALADVLGKTTYTPNGTTSATLTIYGEDGSPLVTRSVTIDSNGNVTQLV